MRKESGQLKIQDLAEHLSLSVATISKALNGRPGVKAHTRRRVNLAAQRMGYVSDRAAQILRRKRSRCIQWQIPTLLDMSYVEFMSGLYEAAKRRGYDIMVTSYERDHRRRDDLCRDAIAQRVEAVISMAGVGGLERLVDARIPILAFSSGQPLPPGVASLEVDYVEGMRQLTHHLIQLGHRRFMIPDRFHMDPRRQVGLVTALREARLPEDVLVFKTDLEAVSSEDLYQRVLDIFRENPQSATALLNTNDQMAVGAMAAIADAGLSVPGDVSVTGMGNIQMSRLQRPALTTLSVTDLPVAETAMQMLADILEQGAPRDMQRTLTPRVVVRQSTGPAKTQERDENPLSYRHKTGEFTFTGGSSCERL